MLFQWPLTHALCTLSTEIHVLSPQLINLVPTLEGIEQNKKFKKTRILFGTLEPKH